MKIKALKALTVYDSQTKDFLSIGHGQIAEVDGDLAEKLISAGLAEKVIEGMSLVKGLVEGTITSITADMLEGVTEIAYHAFEACDLLKSVEIPSNVQEVGGYAFEEKSRLTSATISAERLRESCFEGCYKLENLTLREGVEQLGDSCFERCSSLTNVEIPRSVTSIGTSCFGYCSRLVSVTVLATTPPTLDSDSFASTSSDLKIYVPAESVDAYKAASGWSSYYSKIQAISE